MSKLLGVLLALSSAAFTYSPDTSADDGLQAVANSMMFDGVETAWGWKRCGFANAFYSPRTRAVTLCEEMKALPGYSPGLMRYVLAHELAHGVIIQRDLGYTGSSEWAADELSSMVLMLMGHDTDVVDGANFWLNRPTPEDPFDAHLGNERRGFGLLCMAATRGGPVRGCDITYGHAIHAWTKLLDLR